MAEVRKTGILGLGDYIKTFSDGLSPTKKENVRVSSNYYGPILSDYEMYDKFCGLNDDEYEIDTDLEWALASYYSNAVVRVRPIEADAILPANNPRTAGLKLGSAVLKELAELKFLDPSNTAAIGRYEGMIKFISDKNGVSRADIEKYLKDGIVAVVDAEFNKTRFGLGDYSTDKYYSTTLARNTQTQYILSY
ncbi:MAG: hypothetical protein LBP76_05420, partial [Treponema sp.]|nr:hypothetical protein [Treponema sp.]